LWPALGHASGGAAIARATVFDPPWSGHRHQHRTAATPNGSNTERHDHSREKVRVMAVNATLERASTARHLRGAANPHAASALLAAARHGLHEAATTTRPSERYANAHLAALRCAAAVLAARARPELPGPRRARSRNAWVLLTDVAPELAEWAAFFAAGATKRAAAEAGLEGAVTVREADDLLRDTEIFLALVETTIGVDHQPALPIETARAS
jgi:hypothetical protein